MTNPTIQEISTRYKNGEIQVTSLADGSAVLMDIQGRRVLSMNHSSLFLFNELMNTPQQNEADIARKLADHYGINQALAEEDVSHFVRTLADKWLSTSNN